MIQNLNFWYHFEILAITMDEFGKFHFAPKFSKINSQEIVFFFQKNAKYRKQ